MTQTPVLGLATAALTAAAATTGVLVLADAGREQDGVARLDPHVASGVVDIRTGSLTHLAHALTLLGSEPVVGTLAVLLFIALLERRGLNFAIIAAAAMSVSVGLTVGVKLLVGRPRPGAADRLGPVDHSYSFPSGHTLNSTVFLGLAVILLLPLIRGRIRRTATVLGGTLLAIAIGWSRVYLGYHWTTDVIASWLLAAAVLVVVYATTLLARDTSGDPPRTSRRIVHTARSA
ncbi:MAG: phosphatidic acid phosphatase [Aeromicrobium sp.]|nr:phosphatidic acid phosphatase [Aeromicrobium sp.]